MKMKNALNIIIMMGLAISPSIARAGSEVAEGDTIVVSGSGLPETPGTPAYGSVVIDSERLNNEASNRLENVLLDVAGFQQFRRSDSRSSNPSAQGATLRALGGNASSRTLILLDGVPQADPFFGYIPFSALSPDRLGQIRITRGGGAGAFGAGAVAGTIELESAGNPLDSEQQPLITASALYGSRDSAEISASISPKLGAGSVTLSGRYDRGDGFYTTPKAMRGPNDVRAAYENWSTGLRTVVPINDTLELQARALIYRDDRILRFAGAASHHEGQDASIRLVSRGEWKFDALAYIQARNFSNVVISSTRFVKVLDQRNTPSTGLGGKIEIRPPIGDDHVMRLGVDTRLAEGELFEDAYSAFTGNVRARRNAGGRNMATGIFIEDDWTIGNLTIAGGARADRWTIGDGFYDARDGSGIVTDNQLFQKRTDWQPSFRGGLLYRTDNGLDLRAAAYTGFRLPTLNELYRPFTVFPVVTQANADLDVEKLKGAEIGFDYRPSSRFGVSVTGFINQLDDAISNVTLAPNLRQRQNVDAILAKGVEVTTRIGDGPVKFDGSFAYNHSKVQGIGSSAALDGFAPAQSPKYLASATLSLKATNDMRFAATLRYIGTQFEDDLESEKLPDAITLDAYTSIPLSKGLMVTARAENIFNEVIVTRSNGSAIDIGKPRTFWIGLKFER